jgi:hypothetical protein
MNSPKLYTALASQSAWRQPSTRACPGQPRLAVLAGPLVVRGPRQRFLCFQTNRATRITNVLKTLHNGAANPGRDIIGVVLS